MSDQSSAGFRQARVASLATGYGATVTTIGDQTAEVEQARPIPQAQPRSGRLNTGLVVLLVVAFPALLVVGMSVADGEWNAGDLLPGLLLLLIPGVIGAVIALLVVRRMSRNPSPSSGASPNTRRQMKEALRDGRTTDLRIDALVRQPPFVR
ncbi:hypothetical protein ACLQ29_26605 [Micromonospora sp. DT228]|uniref:hypothetical protein n=1 Tax=Micromonospora sp. DT228 TaxID=3393443 RepID=UPI003CFAAD2F